MATCSEPSQDHSLPIILVSAFDLNSAAQFLSELVDDKAIESYGQETKRIVWPIINKYYKVNVEIHSIADNELLPASLADRIEAHVIYINEDEDDKNVSELAEQRRARGAARAPVRLVALGAAAASAPLRAWAARRRYELVALLERGDGERPDDCGPARVRAALHAHTWRGLTRVDGPRRPPPPLDGADEDDPEACGAQFADALSLLAAARRASAVAPRAERVRAAERVLAAVCGALRVHDASAL